MFEGNNNMKKHLLWLTVVFLLFIAYFISWYFLPGDYPDKWKKLHVGMTRKEFDKIMNDWDIDKIAIKGEPWIFPNKIIQSDLSYSVFRSRLIWELRVEFDVGDYQPVDPHSERWNKIVDGKIIKVQFLKVPRSSVNVKSG